MDWLKEMTNVYKSDSTKVNAFGYILYTDANPHTKKILRDPDYWQALDELSGDEWVIFAIKPKEGSKEFPDVNRSCFGKGAHFKIVRVWREPKENEELLETFGVESTESLPLFILYVLSGDKFLSVKMKIEDDRVEEGFNSLKKAIMVAREAIDRIDQENWKEDLGIYGSIEMQLGHYKGNERLKKILKFFKDSGIASTILTA